jgi:hypothetical protein
MKSFREFHTNETCPILERLKVIQKEGVSAKQMFVQGKALKMLSGGNNEVVLQLIKIYGKVFRDIINDFEDRLGRLPTVDDLIWVAGVHTGEDPRKVAQKVIKELGLD